MKTLILLLKKSSKGITREKNKTLTILKTIYPCFQVINSVLLIVKYSGIALDDTILMVFHLIKLTVFILLYLIRRHNKNSSDDKNIT